MIIITSEESYTAFSNNKLTALQQIIEIKLEFNVLTTLIIILLIHKTLYI